MPHGDVVMIRHLCITVAVVFHAAAMPALAAEPTKIAFPSNGTPAVQLTGYLYRPVGPGPFPAIVALHGCGGIMTRQGGFQKRDRDWADRFTDAGIAVLFPDSFNPRGVPEVCTLKSEDRPIVPFGRAADANGAADWLAAQPFIDKNRLALIGWSHGGSSTLWTVADRTKPKTVEFKTAIAYYPGCRVLLERDNWKPRVPLQILIGALDDWTPPEPCRDLAAKHNIPITLYDGAYHGFDAPDVKVRVREGLGSTPGNRGSAHVGTNPAAREASIKQVMQTLKAAFDMP
jgi:dienelactone hydrolase